MNKIGIIYFSATGNTRFAAENMKEEAERLGYAAELINIEKDPLEADRYEAVVVGSPVMVERYPEMFIKYIGEHLAGYKGRCMLFSTQAYTKPTAAFQGMINRYPHLDITYCEYISMPNNFFNFMFGRTENEEECIRQSIKKSKLAIRAFLEGEKQFYPMKNSAVKGIDFIYKLFYPYLARLMKRKVSIDTKKCIHCMRCERNCPTHSLKLTDHVSFGRNCLLCQRCMMQCPKNAFLYKGKPMIQYQPQLHSDSAFKEIAEEEKVK